MRLFLVFVVGFDKLPLAIAREMRHRIPEASFSGVTTLPQDMFDPNLDHEGVVVDPLFRIQDEEKLWVVRKYHEERLADYQSMFGPGGLRRIITADRALGCGYWPEVSIPRSPLSDMARDPEILRRYIVGLVDFCFQAIEESKPDVVFCDPVDNGWKWALSQICRHLAVPFRVLTATRIHGRWTVDDSPEHLLTRVERVFDLAKSDPSIVGPYIPAAREYLDAFRSNPMSPSYVGEAAESTRELGSPARIISEMLNLPNVLRSLTGGKAFIRNFHKVHYLRERFLIGARRKWLAISGSFRRLGDIPKRPFAYFPMHYEPEAATQIMGHMHTDQAAVVEALVKSLPLGMDLVVKEHTPMLGLRSLRAYRRLRDIPGVILVSPFENSAALIKRAEFTCVITGTAGWEAILLNKPAIAIGNAPFLALKNSCIHCPDLSSLPKAVDQALNLKPDADEEILLYIAATLRESFELKSGLYGGLSQQRSLVRDTESIQLICEGLLKSLEPPAHVR